MSAYQAETSDYTAEEREQLILDQMPQVRHIARRIHETLPGNVSLDDLISSGVIGLAEAASGPLIGADYRSAVAFLVLLAVLIVKPTGLFGGRS